MKKVIFLLIILIFILGCVKTKKFNTVTKKFKSSSTFDKFDKNEFEDEIFYKYTYKNKIHGKNKIYLLLNKVIKPTDKQNEYNLFMGIEYKGSDWIYMENLELSDENNNNAKINFNPYKKNDTYWKDSANIFFSVKEKIVFKINNEDIKNLKNFLNSKSINVKLLSNYDERTLNKNLSKEELTNFKKTINLYLNLLDKK